MRNTWRAPINSVAAYSIIRLWNKGDRAGSLLGMFLMLIGPVGCFFLLCFAILAVVNFWMWIVGVVIVFAVIMHIAVRQALPKYFFNSGLWWENTGNSVKLVDTKWMQEHFTKEERQAMQRKFLKALGGPKNGATEEVI